MPIYFIRLDHGEFLIQSLLCSFLILHLVLLTITSIFINMWNGCIKTKLIPIWKVFSSTAVHPCSSEITCAVAMLIGFSNSGRLDPENSDICSCAGDIYIHNIQFIQLQSIWDRFSLNNITIKTFLISWTLQVSTISWSGPPVPLWDVLDLHQVALSLVCLLVGLREFVKCYDMATE